MKQYFRILGSHGALPQTQVLAQELDERLGLEPGWTADHTGVWRRHQCSGPAESRELTVKVCRGALADAGKSLADVDLIVDASLCVQQPIPCNAALVQETLGAEARGIPSLDVHASCLGFVAALNVVNGLFATGAARTALVVCVETPLQGVNWDEPESACLMGDAAAAFVLGARDEPVDCEFAFETYAEGAHLCEVRAGGHRIPPFRYTPAEHAAYQFHMDGKAVHRLASKLFPPMLTRVLARAGRTLDGLEVVPHQASGPALEFMRRRLGVPPARFHVSVAEHGNVVAAGIPFVLNRVRRQLAPGAPVLLVGTAAGYTQAAALITL
ncbi:3-oxoacyl-[acyl-carrier-protein] synthase III C-terminal domain-containing protein [Opitutus sp. ER46]|uniref:3-oxoacyl-[acyl-carrier-protein] synthase III C-terminal domain-containing protein n=1 Tax=Opitutus sp. ER46 TaxID=2161864 RepID=UPI000D314083|nr:3-oxoacyl-[acyl-carrier-protein] synthase III C-terminal domain-containing protein [Opitutus sp. ER46]PTX90974.1 beta-ketoacyl-ACP synthase III [Opitutus sp. ER46]